MKIFYAFFFSAVCILPVEGFATTVTAVASGAWGTNSTWSCNCQPGSSDNIVIPSGITVTNSGPIILFLGPVITITINGTLVLTNGSLQIDGSDVVVIGATGKITGAGLAGGAVYSGVIPMFIANGSSITGPKTITNGSLPVTLLFFKGHADNNDVLLEWASASELNFDYYEISRSADGQNFEAIAQIKGAGNATQQIDYSFRDNHPFVNHSVYRLQSIDIDGSRANTSFVEIDIANEPAVWIYPNPVTGGEVTVSVNFLPDQNGSITLSDSRGARIFQQDLVSPTTDYKISLESAIERGFYFITVTTPSAVFSKKIIVQ